MDGVRNYENASGLFHLLSYVEYGRFLFASGIIYAILVMKRHG